MVNSENLCIKSCVEISLKGEFFVGRICVMKGKVIGDVFVMRSRSKIKEKAGGSVGHMMIEFGRGGG